MKKLYIILTAAALTGCIKPLELTPDIEGVITNIEVAGQTRTASINPSTHTINIEVGQAADMGALKITRLELVQTATCPLSEGDVVNLSSPLHVVVSTAANYQWTITASRGQSTLPDSDFEHWHRADRNGTVNPAGKVWNPWSEDAIFGTTRWWDTGNAGVTTLRDSNSTATELGQGCPANPAGRAARLQSVWASLKAASGNIYFGRFGGMAGLADAKCEMGHPWSKKPRALRGWFKYWPQMIDRTGTAGVLAKLPEDVRSITAAEWKTRMDEMSVTVALWASPDGADVPYVVNTQLSQFKDLTRDAPGIIAWGQFTSGTEQPEWDEFTLDVEYLKSEYLSPDMPLPANTRLLVTISASKYANYFIAGTTGGENGGGSLLLVDELELVY